MRIGAKKRKTCEEAEDETLSIELKITLYNRTVWICLFKLFCTLWTTLPLPPPPWNFFLATASVRMSTVVLVHSELHLTSNMLACTDDEINRRSSLKRAWGNWRKTVVNKRWRRHECLMLTGYNNYTCRDVQSEMDYRRNVLRLPNASRSNVVSWNGWYALERFIRYRETAYWSIML